VSRAWLDLSAFPQRENRDPRQREMLAENTRERRIACLQPFAADERRPATPGVKR